MTARYKRTIANLMLLTAGAIWGGGFVVMKNALDGISVNWLLAIRFAIGAIGLSYTVLGRGRRPGRRALLGGAATGGLLYGAFAVQTYGLMYTTAAKNALITALYVVLVPFMVWGRKKRRPHGRVLIAAGIMLLGIALLCLQGETGLNIGDLLTLICCLFYAAHIICVDKFSAEVEVMQLTCLQFAFSALFAFAAAALLEEPPRDIGPDTIGALAYCGLAGTLVALTFMNVGIKHASPEYASLFLSTEAAFGCVFGVIFLHDPMTGRMWLGCIMILLALAISQVEWEKIFKKKGVSVNGG